MSGFNQNKRRRTISDDYNHPGFVQNNGANPTASVEVLPNVGTSRSKGGDRLPQFVSEPTQSIDVLISSKDRVSGSLFNFTTDIGTPVFRPRLATVDAVVLPKLHNITPKNNVIRFQAGFLPKGTSDFVSTVGKSSPVYEITIPPGLYTPENLQDTFQFLINDNSGLRGDVGESGWEFEDGKTISVVFTIKGQGLFMDYLTNRLMLEMYSTDYLYDPGNLAGDGIFFFWMLDDSSFIRRGINFGLFPGTPLIQPGLASGTWTLPQTNSLGPATGVVTIFLSPYSLLTSALAGMQYTRFCTVSSNALNRFSYDDSRVTIPQAGGGRGKIISVVDTSFFEIVENAFAGSFLPAQYPNSSVININNAQGQMEQYLDFEVRDEFGEPLDDLFPSDLDQQGFGMTLWMKIHF